MFPQTVLDLTKVESGDQVDCPKHLGWINEAECFGRALGGRECHSGKLEAIDAERGILVHLEPANQQEFQSLNTSI